MEMVVVRTKTDIYLQTGEEDGMRHSGKASLHYHDWTGELDHGDNVGVGFGCGGVGDGDGDCGYDSGDDDSDPDKFGDKLPH